MKKITSSEAQTSVELLWLSELHVRHQELLEWRTSLWSMWAAAAEHEVHRAKCHQRTTLVYCTAELESLMLGTLRVEAVHGVYTDSSGQEGSHAGLKAFASANFYKLLSSFIVSSPGAKIAPGRDTRRPAACCAARLRGTARRRARGDSLGTQTAPPRPVLFFV